MKHKQKPVRVRTNLPEEVFALLGHHGCEIRYRDAEFAEIQYPDHALKFHKEYRPHQEHVSRVEIAKIEFEEIYEPATELTRIVVDPYYVNRFAAAHNDKVRKARGLLEAKRQQTGEIQLPQSLLPEIRAFLKHHGCQLSRHETGGFSLRYPEHTEVEYQGTKGQKHILFEVIFPDGEKIQTVLNRNNREISPLIQSDVLRAFCHAHWEMVAQEKERAQGGEETHEANEK
uniref:Uncharacterized protein n=1 Tax=Thermosporothrix sp. COM3 TaxID=2490863 RepID=A0A455SY05_9CHLR|nr:hypothetical protein KTC_65230 [Thermosporothrix sp. COM3]